MKNALFAVFAQIALFAGLLQAQDCAKAPCMRNDEFSATVGGRTAPDGTQVQLYLPPDLHMQNCGGSDGAGLCVFTSIEHAVRWQNVGQLHGFQDFMKRRPGGGYPEKVDRMIAAACKEKGAPIPRYLQVESPDLEILKLACRTGRMPSVTYSFSPSGRYGGARISHMVTMLHADEKLVCILDNNFPRTWEWMTPNEFKRAYTGGAKNGWSVILLNPGPPPVPKI